MVSEESLKRVRSVRFDGKGVYLSGETAKHVLRI